MDMDMDMIDMESNKVNGGAKSVRIRNYKQAFVYLTNLSKIDSSARITEFRLVEEAEILYIYRWLILYTAEGAKVPWICASA